jgi:hypothetical protein
MSRWDCADNELGLQGMQNLKSNRPHILEAQQYRDEESQIAGF